MARSDRALGNASRSISPGTSSLEETVPVLYRKSVLVNLETENLLTILVVRSIVVSVRASTTFRRNVEPY